MDLLNDARAYARADKRHRRCTAIARHNWLLHLLVHHFFFDDLVVIARGLTPDPIPNSAVKTLSADGTPS